MSDPFVGEIRMFAGNFAPMDWAFCDGSTLSITQNSTLFALIGTFYGGDGINTFNLPDLRGRVPIHQGQGPGLTPRTIGEKLGWETVTLNNNNLPEHAHAISVGADATTATPTGNYLGNSVGFSLYSSTTGNAVMNTAALGASSSAGAISHSNLMPALCINYIISLAGYFPERG